jgi:ECF transporter S component (folate family)
MDTETSNKEVVADTTSTFEHESINPAPASSSSNLNSVYFEISCAVILLAANIIFGRVFSISLPIIRIGFGFIPLMIAGVVLRPYTTALVFVLSDVIGALLFPSGAFFIGFTGVALFNGLACGLLLGWHNLKNKPFKLDFNYLVRIVLASFLIVLVGDLLLNTLMIKITMGKAWATLLAARWVKELIFFALHIVVLIPIAKVYERLKSALSD